MTDGEKHYVSFIGDWLKEKRRINRFTQIELAQEMGVTHQGISNMERGKTILSILQLRKLIRLFNVQETEYNNLFKDITHYGKIAKEKRIQDGTQSSQNV